MAASAERGRARRQGSGESTPRLAIRSTEFTTKRTVHMDPNATLDTLIAAALEGEADTLKARAADLVGWLERGGFAPTEAKCSRVHDIRPVWQRGEG